MLYVTFVNTATGANLGVWSWNGIGPWAQVGFTAALAANESVRSVLAANTDLFAVTALITGTGDDTVTTHSLYYFDSTNFVDAGIQDAAIGLPNSVAYDGSNYWFTAGADILTGTTADAIDVDLTAPSAFFGGVTNLAPSAVCAFTTRDGTVYDYNASWSAASSVFENYRDTDYAFGLPAYVDYGTKQALLVPTRVYPRSSSDVSPAGGYLEFDAFGFNAATAEANENYDLVADAINFSISLDGLSVRSIVAFNNDTLFALTDGNGLWSDHFSAGSWSGWRRE
ncbi:MAG: hypothetical protein E4H20_04805 [Spirochaetales bacterium]|nr:MAG: hypothetical protein E4H20_04805 [Spirochaetales bacterium]